VYVPFEDENDISLSSPQDIQGDIGDSKVHLNWTPVIGATAYKIYYSTNVKVDHSSPHLLVYTASGSVPNLVNNQKYYFKVGAINITNGDNSLSYTVDFTPKLLIPDKPIDLRGTSYNRKIHLSWGEVFHSDYYRVTYTTSSTSQSVVLTTVDHEINIDSLINNLDYLLFVESVNTAGISEASNILKITPLETWIEPLSDIEMVRIKKGNYHMGSPSYELSANDEKPQRLVTITNDFYIGKFEITQKEWSDTTNQLVPHLDYDDRYPIGDKYPVMYVSWKEITTKDGFLDMLNKKIGCNLELLSEDASRYLAPNVPTGCFRLPTEAEWEYVARSGVQQSTFLGDSASLDELSEYVWFNDISSEYGIAEVGLKKPNFWGVFDMYGNVSEWVQDIYEEDFYSIDDGLDPNGPREGYYHVHRGGSWVSELNDIKVSRRTKKDPFNKGLKLGFRLAMTYPEISMDLEIPTITSVQESDSEIAVSWNAVEGAFAYKVSYFSESSIKRHIITRELDCAISGLDNGKEYSIEVIAFNPSQQSTPTMDVTYGTPRQ
jgi:formylglycine-generating enzyme required for sulfatase activity